MGLTGLTRNKASLPYHGHPLLPRLGRGDVGDDGGGQADVALGEAAQNSCDDERRERRREAPENTTRRDASAQWYCRLPFRVKSRVRTPIQ